tara:strand:+ start:35 stop:238 length:204 start_codon:yes stop_codon:yes gene_type:complete
VLGRRKFYDERGLRMATINEWNVEKLEEYSSLYPWVGTEIFLVVGAFIFFLFFCIALFRFDREDYDK